MERHIRQCKKVFALAKIDYMGCGTNPHLLAPREALNKIISNLYPHKRRVSSMMPDLKNAAANTKKKKIKLLDVIEASIGKNRDRFYKEQPAPSNDELMSLC